MRATVELVKANVKIRRTRPSGKSKLIAKHARQTGEIMFAWNSLQSAFYGVFACTVGETRKQHVAHKIWHTIQSDKTQREMLLNAAEAAFGLNKPLFENLRWAVLRAGELGQYRNDAAHTELWFNVSGSGGAVVPNLVASRWAAIARLIDKPTATVWRAVRGDLYALAKYVSLIETQLRWPGAMPKTFPARPRLQSLPLKAPTQSQPQAAKAPALQPKS